MAATAREEVEALKAEVAALKGAKFGRKMADGDVKAPPAGTTGIETPEE